MDYSARIPSALPVDQTASTILDGLDRWWAMRTERVANGFTVRFNTSHASFTVDPDGTANAFGWTCTDAQMIIEDVPDAGEWTGTRLLWAVAQDGGGSSVTMTHHGLGPQIACFDVCTRGWQHFFEVSLRDLLNGGPGMASLT